MASFASRERAGFQVPVGSGCPLGETGTGAVEGLFGWSGLATARLAAAFGGALGGPGSRYAWCFPADLRSVGGAADVTGGGVFAGVSRFLGTLGAGGAYPDDLCFGRRRDDDERSWGGVGAFGFHDL